MERSWSPYIIPSDKAADIMSNPKTTRALTNTSFGSTGCIHDQWSIDNGETTAC